MLELSFEKEVVKTLTTGSNQWVERKDLYGATPDQLWANFRDKLNNNNYAKLQGHPLTDTEFNQVKRGQWNIHTKSSGRNPNKKSKTLI